MRLYQPLGWQPSRFLADRAEAERAFALAERLGNINAAAAELGATWPSLGKAFTRHGLGVPARNPEAVRQRRHRRRPPTHRPALPAVDPVFVALNPAPSPPGAITGGAIYVGPLRRGVRHLGRQRGGRTHSESRARKPTTRVWVIIRRADRRHRLTSQRAGRPDRRHADQTDRSYQPQEREMMADTR